MLPAPRVLPRDRSARRHSICPFARALCHGGAELRKCFTALVSSAFTSSTGFHLIDSRSLHQRGTLFMRNLVTIAALAFTIGVSACSGPQQQEFTRADGEAIRSNTASLTSAFNQKEVEKIVALYDDNSVFMPPNAPVLRGRDPLKSFYGG